MKQRKGFVSNSSSSSFICAICGEIESDRDLCMDDVEMFCCAGCGNDFHESCITIPEDLQDEFDEALSDDRYDVDAKFCPVCQLKVLTDNDEMALYHMENGLSNALALETIKSKYGTYAEFQKACRASKKNK